MKTTILILLACLGPAFATALGSAAASMLDGQWLEFATTGFDWDLIYKDVNNETGSTPNTAYGNRLTWDPGTRTIPFLGLGHYRAWKFMHYTDETNAWTGDPNLPDTCMFTGGSCICHPYNNGTVNTDSSIFYFLQCSEAWDPELNKLYRYDIRQGTWTVHAVPAGYNMSYGYCLTYFPELNALIQLKQQSLNMMSLATGAWSHLTVPAPGIPGVSYHQCMAYSAARKKMVFGGGQLYRDPGPDSNFNYIFEMDTDRTVARLPDAPSPFCVEDATLTSDPVTGDVLLLGMDNELYSLDLVSRTWTKHTDRKPPFTEQALAAPVDNYGVVLFMVPDLLKVYLYRHAGSSPAEVRDRASGAALRASPNPFNASTLIRYSLPAGNGGSLSLFNVRGAKILQVELHGPCGQFFWEPGPLPNGVYVARLAHGTAVIERRLTLVK